MRVEALAVIAALAALGCGDPADSNAPAAGGASPSSGGGGASAGSVAVSGNGGGGVNSGGGAGGTTAGSAGLGGGGMGGSAGAVSSGGNATGGSGGSGGSPVALGLPCGEPFTRGSLKGCLSDVKGHQVKFFPLAEGQAVKNLAVYLHGDLAGEWYDSSAFPDIVEWAQPRGILVLGILSLAVGGDGLPRWGHAQTEHAEKAAKTIEAFLEAYAASRDKIFYWGVSGGSWFMTSSFIAHVGHRVPGIFAASCGGSGQSWGWAWDPAQDTAKRDRIALFMNYGSDDFLAEDEAGSVQDFKARGFTVEEHVYPGAGHCQHAIDEPTLAFWSKHL